VSLSLSTCISFSLHSKKRQLIRYVHGIGFPLPRTHSITSPFYVWNSIDAFQTVFALTSLGVLHRLNDPAVRYLLSLQISSTSSLQAQSCPGPSEQHHLREAVWSLVTAGMKARRPGSGTGSDVCRRGQGVDFCGLAFRQALILHLVNLRSSTTPAL
jgi:hypothetical protein